MQNRQNPQPWIPASLHWLCCWPEQQEEAAHLGKEGRAHPLLHPALAHPTRAGHMGASWCLEETIICPALSRQKLGLPAEISSPRVMNHILLTPPHSMGATEVKRVFRHWPSTEEVVYQTSILPLVPFHCRIHHGVYQ